MKYFRHTFFSFVLLVLFGLLIFQLPAPVAAQVDKPVEIKINPQIFDAYVGQYQDARDAEFIFSFFREGDKFYVQPTDQGRIEIFPSAETKFFLKDFDAQITFLRDAGGNMSVLERPGRQDATRVWASAGKDWHHSKWDHRRIIHASGDKAHVDTMFTRYRADGTKIGSYESLYIVTKEGGRWGVKMRSSFAQ